MPTSRDLSNGSTPVDRHGDPLEPEALTPPGSTSRTTEARDEEEELAGPDLDRPRPPSSEKRTSRLRSFMGLLGPGLITGAADDDPSGVATYSQAGALFGYQMLWTAPLSLPMMYLVQEICDRTALATGDSLGTLCRRRFSGHARFVIVLLAIALVVANSLNIAADLAAIGQGMELLHLGKDHYWALAAGVGLTVALVFGSFEHISKIFKWLCLVLLAYVVVLFMAHVPWARVGRGSLGLDMTWSWKTIALLVGVLGTTISPYMFFWQSAHRIEEMRAADEPEEAKPLPRLSHSGQRRRLRNTRIDVFAGMFVSTFVMFAIMVASAATIGANGPHEIGTAAEAAKALEPAMGGWATTIFALGFIGTGILAVPVLAASGSVALAGLLNKRWGFGHDPRKAPLFYGLLVVGTLGGGAIGFFSDNPMNLLVLSAIINGIAAGPFLIVVMLISGSKQLMGEHVNGRKTAILGWFVTALMCVAGVLGVYATVTSKG